MQSLRIHRIPPLRFAILLIFLLLLKSCELQVGLGLGGPTFPPEII
jgi:hypothetical protein